MVSKVVSTEDGSITWLDDETGELYHNRAGAFTEAWKNYVEPCQISNLIANKPSLAIFDVCFGLGYNSYLFLLEALSAIEANAKISHRELNILAVDKDPKIIEVLPQVLSDSRFSGLLKFISSGQKPSSMDLLCRFGRHKFKLDSRVDAQVTFELVLEDLRNLLTQLFREDRRFDFIFHDGFSPRKVPELWTQEIFAHYARLLEPDGKILTYSSSAAVRGALQSAGLEVRRTAAVGGKSGGTIAGFPGRFTDNPHVFPLSEEEKRRLTSRSATPYRDPSFKAERHEIIRNRESEVRDTK